MSDILLGFQIPTGEPVYIEPSHLICTGITNKSGKTTTLHALATRSKSKVLVFKTKPGEEEFAREKSWTPFFKERADWQYVQELLEATMREKMKFERYWIITATKGTRSLREVDQNCVQLAKNSKEGSLHQSIYTNLHAYFEIVLPELEKFTFSTVFPELMQGVNVMDLTEMSEEMQSLVIRSCLEHILSKERGIITIIPEVWKFAPEGRGNPVKRMLETLIKQGATKKNFVWIDSQDLAGVDKSPLKQVFNWILGLQTERNEVKHTLDQIPLPQREKPKPDDVMTLKLGHFILANPGGVKSVYVQPVWMSEEEAWKVAKGEEKVPKQLTLRGPELQDPEWVAKLREEFKEATVELAKIKMERKEEYVKLEELKTEVERLGRIAKSYEALDRFIVERIENVIDAKGLPEGVHLEQGGTSSVVLTQTQLTVKLKKSEHEVEVDDSQLPGRILRVMLEGKGKKWRPAEVAKAIEPRWGTIGGGVVGMELKKFANNGTLGSIKEDATHFVYFVPEGTTLIEAG